MLLYLLWLAFVKLALSHSKSNWFYFQIKALFVHIQFFDIFMFSISNAVNSMHIVAYRYLVRVFNVKNQCCFPDWRWNALVDIWSKWLWKKFIVSYTEWTVASIQWLSAQTTSVNNVLYSTEVIASLHVLSSLWHLKLWYCPVVFCVYPNINSSDCSFTQLFSKVQKCWKFKYTTYTFKHQVSSHCLWLGLCFL